MQISMEILQKDYKTEEESFAAGEVIRASENTAFRESGLVLEGMIYLETMDENGVRRILDFFREGEFFRKEVFTEEKNTCYLAAKTRCRLVFLSPKKQDKEISAGILLKREEFYQEDRARLLAHIHMLEQHTLRQKLLAFLKYNRQQSRRNPFTLFLPFTDLADYLAVDRSAMMREIGRMEKDGLIRHKGRLVKVL